MSRQHHRLETGAAYLVDGKWRDFIGNPGSARGLPCRVLADASLKWDLGKKAYLVIVDGKVEATVDRLEGESKEDYKTRALAIAAGSQPLPRAA